MTDNIFSLPSYLLNAEQVAQILGTSISFVYSLMAKRQIPVVVLGRSKRIRPEDLTAFIQSKLEGGSDG